MKKKKKKKKIWKWPVNWSFSELFILFFFRPPDPKSEKKIPVNQLIKKFWPKQEMTSHHLRLPQPSHPLAYQCLWQC